MYTPVNPSFTILKWGLRGSKLYRHMFVMARCCKQECLHKIENRMTNSVDPNETARDEPSHLDLHCLRRYHVFFFGDRDGRVKHC